MKTPIDLPLTTPALLFPAISLLLLAYTNRFLTLAGLVRSLRDRYETKHEDHVRGQITNIRYGPDELCARFGPDFHLVRSELRTHVTTWGSHQQFNFCHFHRHTATGNA